MSQLSERYALALYDVVKSKGTIESALETLTALKMSLTENKQILDMLNTPLISDPEKLGILKTALGSGLSEEIGTFFELLIKNNRVQEIPQIITALEEKVANEMGVESGTVRSATELNSEEKKSVKDLIEKKLSKKVELTYSVDSKMIGGIEAKVGSYIFEDSIKTHMQKLNDFITRRVQ